METTKAALTKVIRLSRMKYEAGMLSKETAGRQLDRYYRLAQLMAGINHTMTAPRTDQSRLASTALQVKLTGGRVKQEYR